MISEKIFEVTLNIKNPINFCANKSQQILLNLQEIYCGKCYKGAYITKIKSILNSSKCILESTNTSGDCIIDVQFLAEILTFNMWDIMVGIDITDVKGMVLGKYGGNEKNPQSIVTLEISKLTETLAKGQKIAIRVIKTKYQPMQTNLSILGIPLSCDQRAPIYKLKGSLNQSMVVDFKPLYESIKSELILRNELIKNKRAELWFFESLLYSYRQPNKKDSQKIADWEGPISVSSQPEAKNILSIIETVISGKDVSVSGYWSRTLTIYRSSPIVEMYSTLPKDWEQPIVNEPHIAFVSFLQNILSFLTATRELVECYNTQELIDGHKNIWTVMESMQRPFTN